MLKRAAPLAGIGAGIAIPIALLAALELAVGMGAVNRALVPAPSAVWTELVAIISRGKLWAPLGDTLSLMFTAYICASVLAVIVGVIMGRSRAAYNLLEPLVELQQQIHEEVLRRQSRDALVPIDRDPVPDKYSEQVKRYYEQLGNERAGGKKKPE